MQMCQFSSPGEAGSHILQGTFRCVFHTAHSIKKKKSDILIYWITTEQTSACLLYQHNEEV